MAFKDKYWKTGVEDFLAYKGKKYNGEYPTFREVIEITEERYPDNEAFKAIVPEKLTFTYREALKKIKEIAYYLVASGAKKGDKIAVTGKNSPEWALAYFAISFAGCTIVPLDYSLHIEDMEKILTFGDVDRVFIDGEKINELDKDGKLFKEKISLEKASKGSLYKRHHRNSKGRYAFLHQLHVFHSFFPETFQRIFHRRFLRNTSYPPCIYNDSCAFGDCGQWSKRRLWQAPCNTDYA